MLGRRLGFALCPRRVPGGSGNVAICFSLGNIYISRSAGPSARRKAPFPVVCGGLCASLLSLRASFTVQRLLRGALLFTSMCATENDVAGQDCSFVDSLCLPVLFMHEQKSEMISTASQNEFLQGQIQLYLCIL